MEPREQATRFCDHAPGAFADRRTFATVTAGPLAYFLRSQQGRDAKHAEILMCPRAGAGLQKIAVHHSPRLTPRSGFDFQRQELERAGVKPRGIGVQLSRDGHHLPRCNPQASRLLGQIVALPIGEVRQQAHRLDRLRWKPALVKRRTASEAG